jgi:hypothetical protein
MRSYLDVLRRLGLAGLGPWTLLQGCASAGAPARPPASDCPTQSSSAIATGGPSVQAPLPSASAQAAPGAAAKEPRPSEASSTITLSGEVVDETRTARAVPLPRGTAPLVSVFGTAQDRVWLLAEDATLLVANASGARVVERRLCQGPHGARELHVSGSWPVGLSAAHGQVQVVAWAWRKSFASPVSGVFPVRSGRTTQCSTGYGSDAGLPQTDGERLWYRPEEHSAKIVIAGPGDESALLPLYSQTAATLLVDAPYRAWLMGGEENYRYNGLVWCALPSVDFSIRALAYDGGGVWAIGSRGEPSPIEPLSRRREALPWPELALFDAVARFDGKSWARLTLPEDARVTHVAIAAGTWLLGPDAWWRWDGSSLHRAPPAMTQVRGAWGGPDGSLWVAGTMRRTNGTLEGALVHVPGTST